MQEDDKYNNIYTEYTDYSDNQEYKYHPPPSPPPPSPSPPLPQPPSPSPTSKFYYSPCVCPEGAGLVGFESTKYKVKMG